MSARRMCAAAQVSRASYYRFSGNVAEDPDMELRSVVQKIALSRPSYGYRRVQAELERRGHQVNHKRVRRIMREDNLLCVRRRSFVRTTDSRHGFSVYPNLAKEMVLTDLNQLWVADITYIRLRSEFVYLALLLDAYSRRVIGWELSNSLAAELALGALRMALKGRRFGPGLVPHSDRGVQYAANDYTQLLREHQIQISMSRRGNPYDNAQAESFMKTLKYEEVYRSDYRDQRDVRSSVARFLEKVYNEKRLHSALSYLPPAEFERDLLKSKVTEANA
jgi:transposase InsO family protein